jgi:hypothetical protein
MSTAEDADRPGESASRMLQLLNACLTAQALHVVAELGIADRMADGPAAIDDLAAATGAHRPSLHRLLRMLVGAGVFRDEGEGRFGLTAFGETLRSEGLETVRDWALYVGAPEPWAAWGRLRETVMTGKSGFVLAHGLSTYEYLTRHPELGDPFDRWMTRQSDQHNGAVVAAHDFSVFRTVADVGGGQGSTLAAILRKNTSLRGLLFDQPKVVAGAEPVLRAAGVAERCEVVDGDMLQGVPGGADAYILKRVLMIWGDEPAIRVLRHCAAELRWGDVTLDTGREALRVREPKNGIERAVVLGPTATPRALRGLRAARRGAGRTPADYELLFHSNRGTRISYDALHYQWAKLCGSAGLLDGAGSPRYTPHQLRHTRGSELIAQGQRVEIVQRVLGHRDIRSTLAYAELREAHVRAALERPVLH